MNIKILDSWLREFLDTKASASEIAKSLSLCGASVERLEKTAGDYVYDIEVTTNRVDMMSINGIAREAATILPEFGHKAKLKTTKYKKIVSNKNLEIEIKNNPQLCKRILALKLTDIKIGESPKWLRERLRMAGQRPLNNAVDITNYMMWELGHPMHVFDYDRLIGKKIIVREAKAGETLTTLDKKEHKLIGGEVVFDDGSGEIIDLPGIMGTLNSVVRDKTKNVLLWIESIDPVKIRKASMALGIRSQAAILNEKGVDVELGYTAILRGVELFEKICAAKIGSKLIDIYPIKATKREIKTSFKFIQEYMGVEIPKIKIISILERLGFGTRRLGEKIIVSVPSYRLNDVAIPQDIVEEVARIYGYHNLPSQLMEGRLPKPNPKTNFDFEIKIKNILKGWGGIEIYTSSLVSKEKAGAHALSLRNPLGEDSKYLRKSLLPSLISAASDNYGIDTPFHLFEMANIYLPKRGDLPIEKLIVAGIFANYSFRKAKGIIEAFLEEIKIDADFRQEDELHFLPNQCLEIRSKNEKIGKFGNLEKEKYTYYEFDVTLLEKYAKQFKKYQPIPKFPAQIEDITMELPEKTRVMDVIKTIIQSSKLVVDANLKDIFKNNYTFRIWYQDPEKTLSDHEVEKVRNKIIRKLEQKFGGRII